MQRKMAAAAVRPHVFGLCPSDWRAGKASIVAGDRDKGGEQVSSWDELVVVVERAEVQG